jgi:serine protease Do
MVSMRLPWLVLTVSILASCKRGTESQADGSAAIPSGAVAVGSAAPEPRRVTTLIVPGAGTPASFADLAAKADAAVVYVKTLQEQSGQSGRRRVVGQGLGSGFVYDAAGLILTNHHVIENATDIRVTLENRELKASVVGRDPLTDVAVLKVDGKAFPHLPLGDSDAIRVGDWVVAIGNPFGLSHTVSAGIVSAKGRTGQDVRGLGDPSGYYNFLQTDASINPGNSGGPLLDMAGRVVGINTAIRARANSIGFAIPINMVKELLPALLKEGRIRRSAIGIVASSLLVEDVTRLGLQDRSGVLVRSVAPGGPADRAGLQPDDVIIAFDAEPMLTPEKLRWVASLAGVGRPVTLRVIRGKRTFELKLTLGELPEQPAPREEEPEEPFGFP